MAVVAVGLKNTEACTIINASLLFQYELSSIDSIAAGIIPGIVSVCMYVCM